MHTVDTVLSLVAPALALWLIVLLIRRRLYWRFPCFCIYLAAIIVIGAARFAVFEHYRAYFIVFWSTEALYAILSLLALHEVFRRVFLGFYLQFRWFRALFPAILALAVGLVAWNTWNNWPSQAGFLIPGILVFGIAINLMQVGLFCMFVLLASGLRLQWRHAPQGIALGYAIAAAGALLSYWLRFEFGTRTNTLGKYLPPVAYIAGVVIWLDTFLRPEPEPEWISVVNMQQMAEQFRADSASLRALLDRLRKRK